MSGFRAAFQAERMKLRRTLALAMAVVAPAMVVLLQVLIWLNNRRGFDVDIDLWLAFGNNVLAMWALFMQPLYVALAAALVFHAEHASGGWLRLFTWPLPRTSVLAAKHAVVLALLALSTLLLFAFSLLGAFVADLLDASITLPEDVPLLELASRSLRVFAAALLLTAIQCAVSFRFATISVPLGTGVVGTFVALFATSWKAGVYYPWLMPARALFGPDPQIPIAVGLGAVGGLALTVVHVAWAARSEAGLTRG
ncbi:MAG: ABC transporter permease [Vicinamibacteria bacterium]|jgi:ABC-2 type transport system permease protein|nr:ABC transporter permease [Vicinamibacteria bacterium]